MSVTSGLDAANANSRYRSGNPGMFQIFTGEHDHGTGQTGPPVRGLDFCDFGGRLLTDCIQCKDNYKADASQNTARRGKQSDLLARTSFLAYTATAATMIAAVPKPTTVSQYQAFEPTRPAMIPADPAPGPARIIAIRSREEPELGGKKRHTPDMPIQASTSIVKPDNPAIVSNFDRRGIATISSRIDSADLYWNSLSLPEKG